MIDAVVPARNEADTIGGVVAALRLSPHVNHVIVVDNDSDDWTASSARDEGAVVVRCPKIGLGHAMKAGLKVASAATILKTDGDISNWETHWVDLLVEASLKGLARLTFDSPYDDFPVTLLVAEPLMRLSGVTPVPFRPLTGTYILSRKQVDLDTLPDNWAFDVSFLCQAIKSGTILQDVYVGQLSDRQRPIDHYVPMAEQIAEYLLTTYWSPKS